MNTPAYAAILNRTGEVLVIVGLLDIAIFIYCIFNGISYSSSFNIFALVAGIFLIRGSLRAATIVRWFSVLLLTSSIAVTLTWPFAQPWDLTFTQIRVGPLAFAISAALFLAAVALLFWVQRMLGKQSVLSAATAAGRKIRDMRIPAALGAALAVVLVVLIPIFVSGESGRRAESMAESQLGKDFRYRVSSLQITSNSDGTIVTAVVTAWNQNEIRMVPVSWRE